MGGSNPPATSHPQLLRLASLSFYKLSADLFLGRRLTILAECGRLEGWEEIIDVQERRESRCEEQK